MGIDFFANKTIKYVYWVGFQKNFEMPLSDGDRIKIQTLIAEGFTREAIEVLLVESQKVEEVEYQAVLLLSGRYKQVLNQMRKGLMTDEAFQVACAKINQELLELIGELGADGDQAFERYRILLNELPAPEFIREIKSDLPKSPCHPLLNLFFSIACLKQMDLKAITANAQAVGLAENHLQHSLAHSSTKPTALAIQAFIYHDFYESRQRKKERTSMEVLMQMREWQMIPDITLLKLLKFSLPFERKLKQVFQWEK